VLARDHAAEDAKAQGIAHLEFMERREGQGTAVFSQKHCGPRRVRVKEIARHPKAAVGVYAHSVSVRFLAAFEQDEIWEGAIGNDELGASLDIGPGHAGPTVCRRAALPRGPVQGENAANQTLPLSLG